jgi:hypothetical protein
MGDLDYKREWSNNIYNFEHHIIYPKNSFKYSLLAYKEYFLVNIKEAVYKVAYEKYKAWKSKRKKTIVFGKECTVFEEENIDTFKNLIKIDYKLPKNSFLKKPVFDFIYYSLENQKNIVIYQIKNNNKSYLISSKTRTQKVVFK